MSVAIIPDFVKYQIEWLTSHKDLEFEPVIEDAIVKMLKDTGKSFIDEQHAETSQTEHIADSDKKVEQTAVDNYRVLCEELKAAISHYQIENNRLKGEIKALAFAVQCNGVSGNEVKYEAD